MTVMNAKVEMKFLIEAKGRFVARFDAAHGAVVLTGDLKLAKKFRTAVAARRWAANRAGAGYGLVDFTVEPVTVHTGPGWQANYINAF